MDYVFRYAPSLLYDYHHLVLKEMGRRGYRFDPIWLCPLYRGRRWPPWSQVNLTTKECPTGPVYREHDESYLQECLANLRSKRVYISLPLLQPGDAPRRTLGTLRDDEFLPDQERL